MNRFFIGIVVVSSMINNSYATSSHRPIIRFKNDSGRKTEIFWIDPSSGDLVLQTPGAMSSGETLILDSYVNHTFFIREVPDRTGTCNAGTSIAAPTLAPCKTAFIKVNDHDDGEQGIHITLNSEQQLFIVDLNSIRIFFYSISHQYFISWRTSL
jgi:hypothetical protein